ncbi:glycogenin-2-like [Rhipicephalus sanguineus]|uniref:glycogenin-2-like n=1 Tax=Rhipicephalus sanguineus TaxID=34632 RepID=UPI001893B76D|nr:glycogenin-2-like [Rhipicephalus sanguineus]
MRAQSFSEGTVQANEPDIWRVRFFLIQGSAGRPFFDRAYLKFGSSGAKIVHFWGSDKPWTQVYDWSKSQVHPSPGCQHKPEHLQMWWDVFGRHVRPKLARHPCGDQGRKPGLVCREEICAPFGKEEQAAAPDATNARPLVQYSPPPSQRHWMPPNPGPPPFTS